jgi:predicted acetyltransferase
MDQPQIRRTPKDGRVIVELYLGEQSVSRLSVHDLQMRVGPVALRCGGIGGVGTNLEHRQKGYSRLVINDSLEMMRTEGYHLSALFGIPDYYPQFGFAPALVDCETTIATRDAEAAETHFIVRAIRDDDVPAVLALHAALRGEHSGSIVRDPATWTCFRLGSGWTDRVSAFVLTEGDEVVGYASYNLDYWRFGFGEVGYRDQAVFGSLLAEMARLAVAQRVASFGIHTPPNDPFVVFCRRYGCETRVTYPRRSAGMVRLINQHAVLAAVQPMLAQRAARAGLTGWDSLELATELGTDRVALGGGAQRANFALPHTLLAQWLLGYRSVEDGLDEIGATPERAVEELLTALFPSGYPYLWLADRF